MNIPESVLQILVRRHHVSFSFFNESERLKGYWMKWKRIIPSLFIGCNLILICWVGFYAYIGTLTDTDSPFHLNSVIWGVLTTAWLLANIFSILYYRKILIVFAWLLLLASVCHVWLAFESLLYVGWLPATYVLVAFFFPIALKLRKKSQRTRC